MLKFRFKKSQNTDRRLPKGLLKIVFPKNWSRSKQNVWDFSGTWWITGSLQVFLSFLKKKVMYVTEQNCISSHEHELHKGKNFVHAMSSKLEMVPCVLGTQKIYWINEQKSFKESFRSKLYSWQLQSVSDQTG